MFVLLPILQKYKHLEHFNPDYSQGQGENIITLSNYWFRPKLQNSE